MTVDFELKKVPSIHVASISRITPWKEGVLRTEFRELTAWAAEAGLRTGRWIFSHPSDDRWIACLEVEGEAAPRGKIRMKTLPATWVARVVFNPEEIADRVIYHGLSDWVRWRKRYKEISGTRGSREVYSGDPWSDADAWAHCEVQFLVRK